MVEQNENYLIGDLNSLGDMKNIFKGVNIDKSLDEILPTENAPEIPNKEYNEVKDATKKEEKDNYPKIKIAYL